MPLKFSIHHQCGKCGIEVVQHMVVRGLRFPVALPGIEISAPPDGWTHVGDVMLCPEHPQQPESRIEVVRSVPAAAATVRDAIRGAR